MSKDLIKQQFGAAPAIFNNANTQDNDDLAGGISGGFGVISIRGKAWRIKFGGEEKVLMREDNDGPASSMEVVILKAAPNLSKNWYEDQYEEGSNEAPDCWSANGVRPDPSSPKIQNDFCATCPHNAFGSSRNGKGKACQDSKRLAVVPAGDVRNEMFGGPMLLRIPPASLKGLPTVTHQIKNELGVPYYAVVIKLTLDHETEYPHVLFKPVRYVSEDDANAILEMREHPTVSRILEEAPPVPADDKPAPIQLEGKPPAAMQTKTDEPKTDSDTSGEKTEEAPKRRRRTKAEIEAEKAAKTKPSEPETGEVTEEDDEEAQLQRQLEEARKRKAAKAAEATKAAEKPVETKASAPAEDDGDNEDAGDGFEDVLDGLLDDDDD